jgi:hypothetical protein
LAGAQIFTPAVDGAEQVAEANVGTRSSDRTSKPRQRYWDFVMYRALENPK